VAWFFVQHDGFARTWNHSCWLYMVIFENSFFIYR
jgi:hypothetical protein